MILQEQPNPNIESGVWAEYQDARLCIAHASNLRFQRVMARLQKPFKRKIERNEMDPADQKRILTQALAEAVLLGWEGVTSKDGEAIVYNSKVGRTALENDDSLREFVMEFSADLANFREEEKDHEGNC